MKLAALDYGERHIGVAMTDEDGVLALRYGVIEGGTDSALSNIEKAVLDEEVAKVLVGIPRNLDGEETQQSKKIRNFVADLEEHLTNGSDARSKVIVETIDETLTSVEAEENLKREGVSMDEVHAEAARIMLEDYLRRSKQP